MALELRARPGRRLHRQPRQTRARREQRGAAARARGVVPLPPSPRGASTLSVFRCRKREPTWGGARRPYSAGGAARAARGGRHGARALGRGLSWKAPETCPVSTEGWTRRVHFVREGGGGRLRRRGRARPRRSRGTSDTTRGPWGSAAARPTPSSGVERAARPAPQAPPRLRGRVARAGRRGAAGPGLEPFSNRALSGLTEQAKPSMYACRAWRDTLCF